MECCCWIQWQSEAFLKNLAEDLQGCTCPPHDGPKTHCPEVALVTVRAPTACSARPGLVASSAKPTTVAVLPRIFLGLSSWHPSSFCTERCHQTTGPALAGPAQLHCSLVSVRMKSSGICYLQSGDPSQEAVGIAVQGQIQCGIHAGQPPLRGTLG